MKIRQYISTFLLIPFVLYSSLTAQPNEDLVSYYKNKQFDKLQTRLDEIEKKGGENNETRFFRTALTANGSEAIKIYLELFEKSGSPLKNLLAIKLYQYYYARGFYIKATEYQKLAQKNFPVKREVAVEPVDNINKEVENREKTAKQIYMIQVGAFSVSQNANELASFFRNKKYNVNVVKRIIAGKELYCVWINGESEYGATEKIARDIKNKYQSTYRIVEP